MLSRNHSYFFIPFKVKSIDRWKKQIESKVYIKKDGREFVAWKEIVDPIAIHLMKFINTGIGYRTERHCAYKLMDKRAYGLPYTNKRDKLLNCTINYKGQLKEFEIDICNVRIHCFGTRVGFLVYDIWYSQNMGYNDIIEFNYLFSKVGRSTLLIEDADTLDNIEGCTYLYKLSKEIIGNGLEDEVELFFNSPNYIKMESNIFCVYCDEEKKDINNKLFHLCHSYTKEYEYNMKNMDEDFRLYHPYHYIHWGYCQSGISCVYYDVCDFTHNDFDGKLQNDYYFMYLILLHQRYMLLSLMSEIMNCRSDDSEEWGRIQRGFTIYRLEYSFCVVSDEMPYNRIYKDMREILMINEFENSLKDISDRMHMMKREEQHEIEETSANLRGWRTDNALGLLSLLTVFSAAIDTTDLINMWLLKEEKGVRVLWPHCIAYAVIGFVAMFVLKVLICSYLDYRKKINRKENK
ncbi:MAG: hypothetical protein K2I07_13935 [Lachnospiraceae bacterium]|nr:hypothetical protein [Lachnospiraceae bacterium]